MDNDILFFFVEHMEALPIYERLENGVLTRIPDVKIKVAKTQITFAGRRGFAFVSFKPKSYDRFFIQADACLKHNAFENLHQIQAPTLVIGGEKDNALGGGASREIAAEISGAELRMYEQWGHGLYEEAGDFNQTVLNFLDAF